MRQTRLGSFIEAWVNILVGIGIAYTANMLLLPALGLPLNHSHNITITLVMTVISLIRSYALRRVFNKLRLFHHEHKSEG